MATSIRCSFSMPVSIILISRPDSSVSIISDEPVVKKMEEPSETKPPCDCTQARLGSAQAFLSNPASVTSMTSTPVVSGPW